MVSMDCTGQDTRFGQKKVADKGKIKAKMPSLKEECQAV
jgi:hypothetical protein